MSLHTKAGFAIEVIGYTLILHGESGDRYLRTDPLSSNTKTWWSREAKNICHNSTIGEFLESIMEWKDFPVVGSSERVSLGRVVRIPGEQKVEVLTEPEAGCAWGVRCSWVAPGPWAGTDGWAGNRGPVPMTLEQAKIARVQRGVMDGQALYLVPLRVTESEPRTVVEEVDCE